MAILSKERKPDNFESHNSLKLSFTNIQGLCLNYVGCESFFRSTSPDILAVCETNLDYFTDFGSFSMVRASVSSINPKWFCYSYAWSYSLCEGRNSFCMEFISRKICNFWLALLHSVFYFFPLFLHLLRLCAQFLMLFHLTLHLDQPFC